MQRRWMPVKNQSVLGCSGRVFRPASLLGRSIALRELVEVQFQVFFFFFFFLFLFFRSLRSGFIWLVITWVKCRIKFSLTTLTSFSGFYFKIKYCMCLLQIKLLYLEIGDLMWLIKQNKLTCCNKRLNTDMFSWKTNKRNVLRVFLSSWRPAQRGISLRLFL